VRTLIVTAFTSLDGVVEAPGGEPGYRNAGWTFQDIAFDPAAYEIKGREMGETTALLLGRTSYEAFAPVWPTMDDFAAYNAMPRYVVSTTLEHDDARWPATILRSVDEARVGRYHLLVFPVLLGAGKRLFSTTDKDKQVLTVRESQTYPNGITKLVYDVVR
jgi:dihydrofolate reductase